MSGVKWIKLSVNMFDDEKIKLIKTMPEGDKIIVIWVQLLCMAGRTNDGGLVYMGQNMAYTDEMLATIFDEQVNIVRIALNTLEQFRMVEIKPDGKIDILNWEKHQSTDKMARINEQNRVRQQKYYYRNKLRELGVNVDEVGFTDDLSELKSLLESFGEPNVRLTLPNDTEVRSKKKEVRGKKREERREKDAVEQSSQSGKPDAAHQAPYKEIIDYLNDKAGRSFKHTTKKTQTMIKARLNEGFNLEDFYRVIDNKVHSWLNDKEMDQYLRPETLFGTKFEGYLNERPYKKKENKKAATHEELMKQIYGQEAGDGGDRTRA